MKPFSVGTYEAKTMLCEFLNYQNVRSGYWHFNKDLTIDFYEQLTSEKKYLEFVNGKEYFTWKKPNSSVRNEALDTAVLNLWCIHVSNEDLDTYENKLENGKQPLKIKKNF